MLLPERLVNANHVRVSLWPLQLHWPMEAPKLWSSQPGVCWPRSSSRAVLASQPLDKNPLVFRNYESMIVTGTSLNSPERRTTTMCPRCPKCQALKTPAKHFSNVFCQFLRRKRKPYVRNFSARNSGAGNGCANFMGAWHFLFFLLENPHAHKFPPFSGGLGVCWRGGVEVPFFMGVGIWGFLEGGGGSAFF